MGKKYYLVGTNYITTTTNNNNMDCGELQQNNFMEESLTTSPDTTSDYSKFFNPSLTLYNGLTQEEILDLQRCITVKKHHPLQQNSIKVSKRSRLKNRFKQSFQRIQKKTQTGNNSKLFKSSELNRILSNKNDHLDNDWDSLSCYNHFKTDQLSLLFDISMGKNNKDINNDYQIVSKENNYLEQPNQEQLSIDKFKSSDKNNHNIEEVEEENLVPPLSSSTEKITPHWGKFKNPLFKENQSSKDLLLSNRKFSSRDYDTQYQLFQPINFCSTTTSFSRSVSPSQSSSLSSKHYSIPTFKEKRKQLTVSKIVGNILNRSFKSNSQRDPNLSYQNVKFYSNIASVQSENTFNSTTSSLPVCRSNSSSANQSRIKFDERSSLFVYGNFTRSTHFYNNNSMNLKPILKNTVNKRQNIELKNAEGCDMIDMDKFLQDMIDNEAKRPFDSTQSEMVRNRQLIRYYREETHNLINDHYTIHHDTVATIQLPENHVGKTSENKRRLLGVTELGKSLK